MYITKIIIGVRTALKPFYITHFYLLGLLMSESHKAAATNKEYLIWI